MTSSTQAKIDEVLLAVASQDLAKLNAAIERVLRAQDRDTRYACAEAITALDLSAFGSTRTAAVIALQHAHQACINARSI